MLSYDAVLFDVDGTLLDSAPGILFTLREVFHTMGTDITGVDLMRYVGPPLRKTFAEYYTDEPRLSGPQSFTGAAMLSGDVICASPTLAQPICCAASRLRA